MAFLWLEFGKKQNEVNGAVTQTIYVKSSSLPLAEIEDLTAFYCDRRQQGKKQYYSVPIEEKDGLYFLRMSTASQFFYEIYVTGVYRKEHFTAQIAFSLYADGLDKSMYTERSLWDNSQPFACINLLASEKFSWPQTGQTLQFKYKPIDPAKLSVHEIKIIDWSDNMSETLIPDAAGMFSFTPPHDKRLDDGGYQGYKETIVYVEEVVGDEVYKTSMNLLLHRSLSARHDLKQGIGLFFAAMTAILVIVLFRRRSFKY